MIVVGLLLQGGSGVQFMSCLLPFRRCTKISARQELSTRRRLAGDASSSCAPHKDATRESLECECPAWIGCKTSEKQTTKRKAKLFQSFDGETDSTDSQACVCDLIAARQSSKTSGMPRP